MSKKQLVTVQHAADIMGCTRQWVYNLISQGRIVGAYQSEPPAVGGQPAWLIPLTENGEVLVADPARPVGRPKVKV